MTKPISETLRPLSGARLYLIDGSAYIFRAYHALPPLSRSDGTPNGAVSGFCNMIFKFIEDTKDNPPTHVAVVFDPKGPSFRRDIYPAYKAHRPPVPEDLIPQFALIREAVSAFNIPQIEIVGYEADDVIATLAIQAADQGADVTILSSDKDLMQLVRDGITMHDPIKDRLIDETAVFEKFGVMPDRVIDVQALAGDSADNVPGAPGIGVKTAASLIQEFGDLDALLARAHEIKQPKRRETLLEFAAQIRLSRALVVLDQNVPITKTFGDFTLQPPKMEILIDFLNRMELKTLIRRVQTRMGMEATSNATAFRQDTIPRVQVTPIDYARYETVQTPERLQYWIARIYEKGLVAFDTETTGLDEMRADLVGISLCVDYGAACYIPLGHIEEAGLGLFAQNKRRSGQIEMDTALEILRPMLEDPSILKIGHNIKYDYKIMARYGVRLQAIADTLLMSFAANSGRHHHGMDELSKRYLDHEPITIKSLLGAGKSMRTFAALTVEEAAPYAAEDAEITFRLYHILRMQMVHESVTNVYHRLELPMVFVLAEMEMAGVLVSVPHLKMLSNTFAHELAARERQIFDKTQVNFNVNSPKQLGEVLFDHLGLAGGIKGKNGAYATGAEILEDLAAQGHEIPALVLDYRQNAKLKSTYTDALPTHLHPQTGRIHTSYSISGAATGRLASSDPNLQNIPIRTPQGRQIREAFIAPSGCMILSLDYSQIELRLLAEIAHIDTLKAAFQNGLDIHAMTAAEMFHVPLENMDPMIRRQAKAINFGVIYGISAFGLARNLRIPQAEAKAFIERYFERFPGIRQYMDDTLAFAKQNGHVKTLFGRKIHTPDIHAKGPAAGFAKRAAINAPIQGTAADIIRRAMIRVPAALQEAGLAGRMLLQVHDELIFEVPADEITPTIEVVTQVMENAHKPVVHLDVPLRVDAGIGSNWDEAH